MKKYSESMGYGIYTTDFQATDSRLTKICHRFSNYAEETFIIAMFVGIAVAVGLLMQTSAQAADTLIEYVDQSQDLVDENLQLQQVLNAVEMQRAEALIEAHAEQPPYWTAPEPAY